MATDEKNVIVSLKLKCDDCGSTSRYFTSESEEGSRKKAIYIGWKLDEGPDLKDLCPRCVKEPAGAAREKDRGSA